MTPEEVRRLALGLPEVTEGDHHGRPAFRLGRSILATQWDEETLNVMLDESAARAGAGGPCELLFWGKRLFGLRVDLPRVAPGLVADLLEDAWARRAPARLRRSVADRAAGDGPTSPTQG